MCELLFNLLLNCLTIKMQLPWIVSAMIVCKNTIQNVKIKQGVFAFFVKHFIKILAKTSFIVSQHDPTQLTHL